jgi:Photosynthetic reaction centre cytochrome C subunit
MKEDFMRLLQGVLLLTLAVCGAAAYQQRLTHVSQQQSTPPKTQPSPPAAAQANPNQELNDRFVKQFAERIAGRENEPAEKVFKNIQWLKSTPAGRFLRIMNEGYSRALGVSCTHCHVEQDFASDDKRPKRAAREMAVMHRAINDQLAKMQNLDLKPEQRFINCSTCHRGAINPLASER